MLKQSARLYNEGEEMKKKEFKTESKKLMDLMINSIYTNKEIFLREIISNASDAIDKLHYMSLTDKKIKVNKKDFAIFLKVDKDKRTLTISDNGIGMNKEELETNLGTIAKSGSQDFKINNEHKKDIDIILGIRLLKVLVNTESGFSVVAPMINTLAVLSLFVSPKRLKVPVSIK